jgi:hypothetical protein
MAAVEQRVIDAAAGQQRQPVRLAGVGIYAYDGPGSSDVVGAESASALEQ